MDINHRVLHHYEGKEAEKVKNNKQITILQIDNLRLDEEAVIHDNQAETAYQIVGKFTDKKIINQMVLGQTQSGKTGCMLATIQAYLSSDNMIPIENIFVITGLSSVEWKAQTISRFPQTMEDRIFHRSDLREKFVSQVIETENILIIMDEIQIASKKDQTIYKAFEDAGLLSIENLFQKDIKIVEFSATPNGTIYDLMEWKSHGSKILSHPGECYISSRLLLEERKVKQFKELCGPQGEEVNKEVLENIKEIESDIKEHFSDKAYYHFIRSKSSSGQDKTIANFKEIFPDAEYIIYDLKSDIDDINEILVQEPKKHTFIFVKEMLRCAKTLEKEHLGIMYDRYSKRPDDSVMIQGFIGRLTGYDYNQKSICYTNISSIERYFQLWDSDFEDTSVEWKSHSTTFKKGVLSGKNTFNSVDHIDGLSNDTSSVTSDESEPVKKTKKTKSKESDTSENLEDKIEPIIVKRKTLDEIKEYYNKNLKDKIGGRGPNKKKPNADGFYEAKIQGVSKVFSDDEMFKERKWALNQKSSTWRCSPCYTDISDKFTLEWWLIHYE
jgi:hypothetical protein